MDRFIRTAVEIDEHADSQAVAAAVDVQARNGVHEAVAAPILS